MPFDTIDPAHLNGNITQLQVIDLDQNPNTILETAKHWGFRVNWTISGPIAGSLGGRWHVRAYLEPFTGGLPGPKMVGQTFVDLNTAPATPVRNYTATVFPLNAEPEGAYKLVVLINYENNGMPQQMAAFQEGPIVQFYVP